MTLENSTEETPELLIRPIQLQDLSAVETLLREAEYLRPTLLSHLPSVRRWYAPLKALSLFPNRLQHFFNVHVAEEGETIQGIIQVSPFNHYHSTWEVNHLVVAAPERRLDIGSRLLRHCMERFREAQMWLLEVNIHNCDAIALYRHNGFQHLAQLTYWSLSAEILAKIAQQKPELANLMPVRNHDAQLLYRLETAPMPPLLRQVYDLHVSDFRSSVLDWAMDTTQHLLNDREEIRAYVYEPERKAAIAYFHLKLARKGQYPHLAKLTVHPAYTELYPQLVAQMARLTQVYPPQPLILNSTDYQPEREEYLLSLGAEDVERTLLMSRSVWHKLRESRIRLDSLTLQSLLRTLQVNQPIPERFQGDPPPLLSNQEDHIQN